MEAVKTSEKITLWMFRNDITGKQISDNIGITRQAWSNKMKTNTFTSNDLIAIKRMGFKG